MFNAQCSTNSRFVSVALPLPISRRNELIYRVPDALLSRAQEGVRVVVPVSSRKITGIIVGQSSHPGDIHSQKVKDILDIIDEVPIFSQDMKNVWKWIAHYYFSSSGAVLQTILPRTVRHQSTTSVALPKKKGGRKKPNTEDDRRKQLLVDRLKEGEKELLAYITEKKRSSVKTLHRRFPQLATRGTLQHLESLNLIRLAESFPRPRTITESNESIAMAGAYAEESTHDSGDNGEQTQWDRLSLTSAQQNAQSEVENALKKGEFRVFLLHGVTGSGKTEVYLRAARYAVSQDKSALFLVPEIALTHQLVAQVRQRFGGSVAVLHSAMTGKERWDEWKRIARREIAVVVGARSAIFAPLMNLGLIIVDEEHETAYKQEDGIRYNARDIAIVRGKISSCPVILGSATPALESYTHSQTQHYTALTLPTRVAARPLPQVEIVDLRRESRSGKTAPIFSTRLQQALRATYQAGKQSVLFLNRRGYANYLQCRLCGETLSCPHCSVSLTFHLQRKILCCHYCGFTRRSLETCPTCKEPALDGSGIGTEQVEDALKHLLPEVRIARLDRDTVKRRGTLDRVLRAWRAHEFDVLIGTQMVAKGHDVPGVTLVGVILADVTLNRPDFRAAERTFQLLTQVAGRAGRGQDLGTVIIQTYAPRHYSIQCAARHDFTRFAAQEQRYRKQLGYPPFTRLINVRFEGRDGQQVEATASLFLQKVEQARQSEEFAAAGLQILGPAPAPIERIKGRERWQLLVKGPDRPLLHALIDKARGTFEQAKPPRTVRTIIDVDPYSVV